MRKFYIFTVFFIIVMIVVTLALPLAMALPDPYVGSDTALLVETKSGTILYEKNKDIRIAPDSVAKVMTLLLALEAVNDGQVNLHDNVTASTSFLFGLEESDDLLGISPGETLRCVDLLYAAYLVPANDVCNILAEKLSGSISAFVDKMNEKAKMLGCSNTHFSNAGGMADPDQYTTAWDQYLILKEAAGQLLFRNIAATSSYKIDATAFSPERSLENSNAMLRTGSEYYYGNYIAGVAGKDENSFITYAEDSELSLISVVSSAESAEGGGVSSTSELYEETVRLLDWGFSGFAWYDIVSKNDVAASEEIVLAKGTDSVSLRPSESLKIVAPRDMSAEDISKEIIVFGKNEGKTLTAPVREGDILGEMKVYVGGTLEGKVKLVAAHDVALDRAAFIKTQILHTLSNFWVLLVIFIVLILGAGYIWLVLRDRRRRREKRRKIEKAKEKIIEERQNQKNGVSHL